MAETKTERTETTETTVSRTGPQGGSQEHHSETTHVDADGKTSTASDGHEDDKAGEAAGEAQQHNRGDGQDGEPAEVDASMPPGGTYS